MTIRTLEQKRAQITWERLAATFGGDVTKWPQSDDSTGRGPNARKYLGALKKTPARIHSSGLGQALAFLKARGQKQGDHDRAYEDLSRTLYEVLALAIPTQPDFLGELIQPNRDAAFLFRSTDETVALLGWMILFLTGAGVKAEEEEEEETTGGDEAAQAGTISAGSEDAPGPGRGGEVI